MSCGTNTYRWNASQTMRYLSTIILLFIATSSFAQSDTLGRPTLTAPAIGTALVACGSLFTFQPTMNALEVGLRNSIHSTPQPRLYFDDQLQFSGLVLAPTLNLCGVKSRNSLKKILLLEGGSYILGYSIVMATKYGIHISRPDERGINSFPSGHTFTAFAGAEVLRREYGQEYPGIAIAGYALASLVGAMRIYNNRHWLGDVLAGAGIAILSVGVTYWLFE